MNHDDAHTHKGKDYAQFISFIYRIMTICSTNACSPVSRTAFGVPPWIEVIYALISVIVYVALYQLVTLCLCGI